MKRLLTKKRIKLREISPSNPPRKASWERVEKGFEQAKSMEEFIKGILLLEGGEKYGLPPLLPHEGNHRIAKLFEVFGGEYAIEFDVFQAMPDDDLSGFIRGQERCRREGIRDYADFVKAAHEGRWERTI